MTIDAVYFDLDGTLVDSEHLHAKSWEQVLSHYDIYYANDDFCIAFAGKPTLEAAKIMVSEHQLPIAAETLAERKHGVFSRLSTTQLPKLLPHAVEILTWCKSQGLKIALVTGSAKAEAHAILKGHKLFGYFDVIFTRDDVKKAKPDPAPYLVAVEALNSTVTKGVAIEDTVTGAKSAVAAGLFTAVVPNKYSFGCDFSHADTVCDNLQQVQLLIARNR